MMTSTAAVGKGRSRMREEEEAHVWGECDSLRCHEAMMNHKQRSDVLRVMHCLTNGQPAFFMHADVHT